MIKFTDSGIVQNCFIGTETSGSNCVYYVYVLNVDDLVNDDILRDTTPTRIYDTLDKSQTFLEGIAYALNFGLVDDEVIYDL